ncbi:MAG: cytidylyltransferase domain-containing protein [Chloroflexota bacterium]
MNRNSKTVPPVNPTGIDSPDIVKYFTKRISYHDWLSNLDRPLSKTVVNIPARSSSKRLPNKNIKLLNGLPLLAYSIILAKNMPGVDRVFVNTDSREYADIAMAFGAESPFLRPPDLAKDDSSVAKANHFLTRYLMEENYPLCSIIVFYPTSPFRSLAAMNELTTNLSSHSVVMTCLEVDYAPEHICLKNQEYIFKNRHDQTTPANIAYKTTGSFLGINRNVSPHGSADLYFHNNPIEAIDIDTEEDFRLAEMILQNNLYDFGIPICA